MKRKLVPLARELRKRMTDAEIKLWKYLSRKQLGVTFRRQYPIGNYIVDFVSFDVKLVVEVDGVSMPNLKPTSPETNGLLRKDSRCFDSGITMFSET